MKGRRLLTKSETQVMRIVWSLPEKEVFTSQILAQYDDPKPAYTTLATFLKILTNKGFVKSKKVGAMLAYTPCVDQKDYLTELTSYEREDFFGGDITKQVAFLLDSQEMTNEQIDNLISQLQAKKH